MRPITGLCLMLLIVSGCDRSPAPAAAHEARAKSQPAQPPNTPEGVATAFLQAGNERDLSRMQSLLTDCSKRLLQPILEPFRQGMTQFVKIGPARVAQQHPDQPWAMVVVDGDEKGALFLRQQNGQWRVDLEEEFSELSRFLLEELPKAPLPGALAQVMLNETRCPQGWELATDYTRDEMALPQAVIGYAYQRYRREQIGHAIIEYRLYDSEHAAQWHMWRWRHDAATRHTVIPLECADEAWHCPPGKIDGSHYASESALRLGAMVVLMSNVSAGDVARCVEMMKQ